MADDGQKTNPAPTPEPQKQWPTAVSDYFPLLDDKPVTPAQAQSIFETLSKRADISFGYAYDGCYARAHLMCEHLLQDGHTPGKAWAFRSPEGVPLVVNTPAGDEIYWRYHVAPTLPVQMPDGRIENMVLDPSLFDGPVSQNRWGESMGAKPSQLHQTPLNVAPAGHQGDYNPAEITHVRTTELANDVMHDFLHQQNVRRPFACDLGQCTIGESAAGKPLVEGRPFLHFDDAPTAEMPVPVAVVDDMLQRNMRDYMPAYNFEKATGLTGIAGNYKYPGGLNPVAFDDAWTWTFAPDGGTHLAPTALADKGIGVPPVNPREKLGNYLERLPDEVKAAYRSVLDELVSLNPELKNVRVDRNNIGKVYEVVHGVASGFNVDDINYYLEADNSSSARRAYFKDPRRLRIENETGARPAWIASPETLDRISAELDTRKGLDVAGRPGASVDIQLPLGEAGAKPPKITAGATGAALGLGMGVVGLENAIETGDVTGGAIASANIATATVEGAEAIAAAAGKSLPALKSVSRFVPGANAAITVADGIYQVAKEDTAEHRQERIVAVGATTGTAIALGTAVATAGEAAAITTGVTTVLGTGAAGAGTAAVVVAAAPVVLTAAAVVTVAYTGEKVIEAKRAWDDVDRQIAENGAPQRRTATFKGDDGSPDFRKFKHIFPEMLEVSRDIKDSELPFKPERDPSGRIKFDDMRKLAESRDPKFMAEFERALDSNIAKNKKIMADNDSILPKWIRSGDSVDKYVMAQMVLSDLEGAKTELGWLKADTAQWEATHGRPATPPPQQKGGTFFKNNRP